MVCADGIIGGPIRWSIDRSIVVREHRGRTGTVLNERIVSSCPLWEALGREGCLPSSRKPYASVTRDPAPTARGPSHHMLPQAIRV